MSIAFRASVALDPVLWSVPGDGRGPTDAVCAEIRETTAAAAKLRRGVIEIPTTRGLNCLNPIYEDPARTNFRPRVRPSSAPPPPPYNHLICMTLLS